DLVVLYSGHNELLHRLTQPSPFGRGSFPWRLWPRIAERLERWHEASREPAPASRPARIPEDQWGAVGLALRTLAGGDREKNVWSSLPVTDRERELHLERWRTNLGAIVARIRDRKVPLVAIRPTSNLRVPPLSAGRGFDERALRAYEDGDFVRARDLDPAPVRMTSAHGAAFDETLRAAGVPVVDGDDCAREACATEVLGEQCFVDLMHPRERVYARFAEKVADRMGELGLPGLDAKGRARFREAAEEILARNAAVVAQGEVDSANLLVLLYLTYGNRAAAEQCGRAFPEERRDLRLTLAFDLALRFGGKIREADATLDRAVVRHAEWSDAIGWWRARAGAASEAP
ncbi:MAG TPA: hypothetical protein VKE69_07535, partial [Planctomycetota bacterium]|nr:hypothetical protein [Planctomycetota bacterium]